MTKSVHTKTAERMWRTHRRIGREIVFDLSTAISCSQEQAEEDADHLIVTTAIDLSQAKPVAIVGEDVDLNVLITQLSATNSNVYFLKPDQEFNMLHSCIYRMRYDISDF